MTLRGFLISLQCTALCAAWPLLAQAGAWPRGEGQVFLSFSSEAVLEDAVGTSAFSVFGEVGFGPSTTLGAELRFPTDGIDGPTGYFEVRQLVVRLASGDPLAVSARFGYSDFGGNREWAISPGISFGHGFTTPLGNGWANFDGWLHQPLSGGSHAAQIEAQIGTRISVNWMLMFGASRFSTSNYDGTKITPSIALRIGNGRTIQFSYSEEFGDIPASSLEASLWMEF